MTQRGVASPPRLVVFSPLPPTQNGIADYAAALLPGLARQFRCTVVIDDDAEDPTNLPPGVEALNVSAYSARRAFFAKAHHLFHIGNNPDHIYMIEPLRASRGVVVLHDPSLHYLLDLKCYHGWADLPAFKRTLQRDHGVHGLAIADQAIRMHWTTDATHTDLPALGLVLEHARGVIVHSEFACNRVRALYPDLPVALIPHFAEIARRDRMSRRILAREKLGLPPNATILLTLGFVNRAKQIPMMLDALSIVRRSHASATCVIAGRDTFDGAPLSDEISARGLDDAVRSLGYVPDDAIAELLDACDMLLNLRYPTQGETSGTVSRALARGVCTIVTNHGWFGELPDDAVIKTPPLPNQPELLAGTILHFLSRPDARRKVEQAALAYAETHMALAAIVERYAEAIEASADAPPRAPTSSSHLRLDLATRPARDRIEAARRSLPPRCFDPDDPQFCGTLWWVEGLFPGAPAPDSFGFHGPRGLRSLASALFGCDGGKTARAESTGLSWGLCVGQLESLLGPGRSALAAFLSRFVADGVCVFNFWRDAPARDAASDVAYFLADFGFETLHRIDRTAAPVDALLQINSATPETCVIGRFLRLRERFETR
ncbi:MAG TPA: glycosyltransferase family 4 protein [Methylocystis sp.]|nr:glycosyltransferase family 4 protein [Methylocystis sp.]